MQHNAVANKYGVIMRFLFLFFFAVSSAASAQVYKCTIPGGGVSMQQTPCAAGAQGGQIEVRPGSGHSPAPKSELSDQKLTGATRQPSGSTYVDQVNRMTNERRIRELTQDREELLQARDKLSRDMDTKLASLKVVKGRASNNLAGATWEQSLSTEMLAVVETYKVKAGMLDIKLADVDAQLSLLPKK